MIETLVAIAAGLLLLSGLWRRADTGRAAWLRPVELVVGLRALVLGLLAITELARPEFRSS